jgi:hypothetical protein
VVTRPGPAVNIPTPVPCSIEVQTPDHWPLDPWRGKGVKTDAEFFQAFKAALLEIDARIRFEAKLLAAQAGCKR